LPLLYGKRLLEENDWAFFFRTEEMFQISMRRCIVILVDVMFGGRAVILCSGLVYRVQDFLTGYKNE